MDQSGHFALVLSEDVDAASHLLIFFIELVAEYEGLVDLGDVGLHLVLQQVLYLTFDISIQYAQD